MKYTALVVLSVQLISSGCGYTVRQVAEPSTITLDDALVQVAHGLNHVREETKNQDKEGLIPDEVTVTFNVSAKATSANSGTLNVANVPLAAGTIGGSVSSSLNDESNRGNVITVKFKSLATADLSKGMYAKGSTIDRRCLYAAFRKANEAYCRAHGGNALYNTGIGG